VVERGAFFPASRLLRACALNKVMLTEGGGVRLSKAA
jgi:hypothetical protein